MNTLLTEFLESPLRPDGTLKFHELQGFLFAITCSPELIRPSEWVPLIFNEQDAAYASMEEAESVMSSLMALYNEQITQFMNGGVCLPADISLHEDPLDNMGEDADLGQWSRGLIMGHDWLVEVWDAFTPELLDEELGSCLMVMSFFATKELAQAFYDESERDSGETLDEFAKKMLEIFEPAMLSYADLGSAIRSALEDRESGTEPYVSEPKIGRNDPCPCGSGKKYKKCCLH